MNNRPLVQQSWIRVILFVITLLAFMMLVSFISGKLITSLNLNAASGNTAGVGQSEGKILMVSILLSVAASLTTVALFCRVADKRTVASLGLQWEGHQAHAASGFFTGLFLLGAGSFILIANHNLEWIDIAFNPSQLFIGLVLAALVSFSEELVFRGYILNNLMQSVNKWAALAISALLFALFHSSNPGISTLAMVNVFLAGLMLGVNYLYTRNLWFGMLLHFSWNFYQGPVLGYKVSGYNLQSLLQQELSGNRLLTGGNFGLEGSVLAGLLSLGAFIVLAMVYNRKFRTPVTTPAARAMAVPAN